MALETATYISDLVTTNPVDNTDTVASMGAHLRLLKSTVKTTLPNVTGAVTKTHTQLNNIPTLLATLTASNSASLSDTTSLTSTYKSYEFRFINMLPATDGQTLFFNVSIDGGANWKTDTAYKYVFEETYTGVTSGGSAFSGTNAFGTIDNGTSNSATNGGMCGIMRVINPANASGHKRFLVDVGTSYTSGSLLQSHMFGFTAYTGVTSAINAIKFAYASGNITSGSIEIWGIP